MTKSVPESPSKQLAGFIAKYDPAVAKLARAARTALRKRLPTAVELVYDNYQFLAIGFAAVNPKKLKGAKAFTIAVSVWAVFVVCRVGWAFVFS